MLTVKTLVKLSNLEGLGLFAAERIPKGTTVWKFDPRFDLLFDPEEVEMMESIQKELILKHGALLKDVGKYLYCSDDARFINHSSKNDNLDVVPTPGEPITHGVANRDIEIGEEILINYRVFDETDAKSSEEYLNT